MGGLLLWLVCVSFITGIVFVIGRWSMRYRRCCLNFNPCLSCDPEFPKLWLLSPVLFPHHSTSLPPEMQMDFVESCQKRAIPGLFVWVSAVMATKYFFFFKSYWTIFFSHSSRAIFFALFSWHILSCLFFLSCLFLCYSEHYPSDLNGMLGALKRAMRNFLVRLQTFEKWKQIRLAIKWCEKGGEESK